MASTGSVLALQYKGGVLLACDTLISYGSMAMIPNASRCVSITKHTIVASSGSFADFQNVVAQLHELCQAKEIEYNCELDPSEVFTLLQRIMYNLRSNMQPLLCTIVVAGIQPRNGNSSEPLEFIGVIDNIGTHWTARYAGTSYAQHMAVPLIRESIEKEGLPASRDDALCLLRRCLQVLFYRECKAINRWLITDVTINGITQAPPTTLDTEFSLRGYEFGKTALFRL
ncbi:hypothetical protein XU18_1534 [Perkinsela sp. CCAP 1560/4]|nr:hypothetical protein XU18_1534 [Perkinsela sp. CCAP 1560/4]|eukprot:KNH07857.1 hypothetical protein XU18_1534 [Perkinsela sp. CCAP 1560/4]